MTSQQYITMRDRKPLQIEPITLEDIPAITALWFASFTDPSIRRVFPDTPGVRQWLEDANRRDMTEKPFQRYVKVVDTTSQDSTGRSRIAAYAKWDLSMPEERGSRYPPWHEDMPRKLCDEFFAKEEENRKRVMRDRKHICMSIGKSCGRHTNVSFGRSRHGCHAP